MSSNRLNYRRVDIPACCMTCGFKSIEFGLSTTPGVFNCAKVKYDSNPHAHAIYDEVCWDYVCDNYQYNPSLDTTGEGQHNFVK